MKKKEYKPKVLKIINSSRKHIISNINLYNELNNPDIKYDIRVVYRGKMSSKLFKEVKNEINVRLILCIAWY